MNVKLSKIYQLPCLQQTHLPCFVSVTGENLHCGTPINPASSSLIPGGSCSGSAVAVAAQLVDFALGISEFFLLQIPTCPCK